MISIRAPRKKRNEIELTIVKAFWMKFILKYPEFEEIMIRFEHGGFKLSGGSIKAWTNVGIKKGIPDYGFFYESKDYKMLWIEFKAPGKKLSDEQEAMKLLLEAWGSKHVTCWSEEEGIKEVKDYLK